MTKTSLEQSIMSALNDDTLSAADLTDLIADTESAIIECEATAQRETERAIDPMLSNDARQARSAAEDSIIAAGRLKTLLPRLEDRARSVVHATARTKWTREFHALETERNNLATELKAKYPRIVDELASLFGRAEALRSENFPAEPKSPRWREGPTIVCRTFCSWFG